MTDWIQAADRPSAVARVICLPRAGGNARDFDPWQEGLGDRVQLCAVQLPGRLNRFREPAIDDLLTIAAQVAGAVQELDDLPYVMFGDCMGALVAFEVARFLRQSGGPSPRALVVASYPAPDQLRTERPYHAASAEELRQRLREVGGVPPIALAEDELFELLLPMLRADFAVFECYRYEPEPPLDVEIHAMAGTDDPYVSFEVLEGWRSHTTAGFSRYVLPGGHSFLREGSEAVEAVRSLALAAGGCMP